jgi:outer membrane protein OmpA-like peptidoglycan-associated protein
MKIRQYIVGFAGIALAAALSSSAYADSMATHKGLYVSGALGANWLEDSDVSDLVVPFVDVEFDTGYVGAIAVGYGLGNGLRIEGELAHRRNDIDAINVFGVDAGSGDVNTSSLMLNLVYDINLNSKMVPYLGVGIGFANIDVDGGVGPFTTDDNDNVFAYQGIAGIAYHLQHQLDLFLDYRYFRTEDPDFDVSFLGSASIDYESHSVMLGLRYRFATPKPAPRPRPAAAPAPPPPPKPKPKPMAKPKPPPPPPPPPRSFIVFFDWDKSNIRADAQRVIEAATAYAKRRGFVRVSLAGHADRSGTSRYNMGLSLRRAAAVKAAFVKLGIRALNIAAVGRGESQPLVATRDGVREPRNRRVEIVF